MSNLSYHDSSQRSGAELRVKLTLMALVVFWLGGPLLLRRLITGARMPDWATWAAALGGVLAAVILGRRVRRGGEPVGVGHFLLAAALYIAAFLLVALLTGSLRALAA